MGNEGQESPRDVAGEKQKHPWEVFPNGETSTENGGKQRENRTNKKEKKGLHLPKNKPLLIGVAVLVVALIVGAVFGIKLLTEKKPYKYDGPVATVLPSSVEDNEITVENAATADLAYSIAATSLRNAALEGVNVGGALDSGILMDNIEAYIKKQNSESDKLYYKMVAVSITSLLEETDVAKHYLEEVDEVDFNDLNEKQKYAFFISHRLYYHFTEDEDKVKYYDEWFDKEFPEEEYIEAGTNNKVEPSEEEKAQ